MRTMSLEEKKLKSNKHLLWITGKTRISFMQGNGLISVVMNGGD